MNSVQVNDAERRIEAEKSSKFRGRAQVPLEFLYFSVHCPRDLDRSNVERLKGVYLREGINRLKPENHVPAIIRKADLKSAIKHSGTSLSDLLNRPQENLPQLKFPPNFRLQCLHGKHRIQAANELTHLKVEDKWWTVTFYLEDLSEDARRSLIEDYSNSKNFSDGLIFRKIAEYKPMNIFAEQHWWSWLTDSKRDILSRIFEHSGFSVALCNLLRIPALLDDLNISLWHKIIATLSDEEFIHYFGRIILTFDYILGGDETLKTLLDAETVQCVQSRCPGASQEDLEFLDKLMWKKEGRIFSAIDCEAARQRIWKRLRKIDYLIPTLGSLQKDFKYLSGPAKAMKRLLKPSNGRQKGRRTLREFAELAFLGGRNHPKFESKFQELYLHAMRDVFDMVEDSPLKERGKKTPIARPPDPVIWHRFANFAYTSGFESPEIHRLRKVDPYWEKARQKLLDRDAAKYNQKELERLVAKTAEMYRSAAEDKSPESTPRMLLEGPGESMTRRRGRHWENAYEYDRHFMFLTIFRQPVEGRGNSVSSLFVRRSVFYAFFPDSGNGIRDSGTYDRSDGPIGTKAIDADVDMLQPNDGLDGRTFNGHFSEPESDTDMDSTEPVPETATPMLGNFGMEMREAFDRESTRAVAEIAHEEKRTRQSSVYSTSSDDHDAPGTASALQLLEPQSHDQPGFVEHEGKHQRTAYVLASTEGHGQEEDYPMESASKVLEEVHKDVEVSQTLLDLPQNAPSLVTSLEQVNETNAIQKVPIIVYTDFNGGWEEIARCSNQEEVEDVVAQCKEQTYCYPATKDGRGIMISECYDYAINGDGCVYITMGLDEI